MRNCFRLVVVGSLWFAQVDVRCKQYFDIWGIIQTKDNQASLCLKGRKANTKCLRAGNICWKQTTSPYPSTNKKYFCEPWNLRSLFFSGLPLCGFPVVWCFGWAQIASCLSANGLLFCPSSDGQPINRKTWGKFISLWPFFFCLVWQNCLMCPWVTAGKSRTENSVITSFPFLREQTGGKTSWW